MNHHQLDHRFFPLIFDSIAHGIFTIDAQGRITSFNKTAEEVTGHHREEVIGQSCSAIFRTDICQMNCPLKSSIHTGKRSEVEDVHISTKTGESLPVAISTAALFDENGRIIGGVEMFRDQRAIAELRKRLLESYVFEDIVSKNHRMQQIFKLLPLVAHNPSTVMISGESGTGKELIARAIHNTSLRRNEPFVALNCAALPDGLLESELFGYRKGAFTDAKTDKPGRFALAQGGTLFLDEIGEISKNMQAKLLRVIQHREYEPLGAIETVKADVRIIASTNRDLQQEVNENRFRHDLYYRLNVVEIKLPPLRERREDVPLLVDHFIKHFNAVQMRRIVRCSEGVLATFMRYPFPGNIRELENAVEHAFVVCTDNIIQLSDLPQHILDYCSRGEAKAAAVKLPLEDAEAQAILAILKENDYHRGRAAAQLGISRNTLWRKMKKYRIPVP